MTRKRSWKVIAGLTKGNLTRQAVVAQALEIAALEGLSAISIGRLAKELRMSKSGLFLHFGSKEKLESAVVEAARVQFFNHVVRPVNEDKLEGVERLWVLCDRWLDFAEKGPLFGGYFFPERSSRRLSNMAPFPARSGGWCGIGLILCKPL